MGFNKNTKQVFSFRKFTTGTDSALIGYKTAIKVGVVGLATTGVMAMTGGVSAEQITPTTAPTTSQVAPTTTDPTTATTQTAEIPTSVPSGTTQDVAKTTIDSSQDTLKETVTGATDSGVKVNVGETETVTLNDQNVVPETNKVLTDLNAQNQAVKDAQAKSEQNDKAYTDATVARDKAVSEGQADLGKSTQAENDQIAIAEKNGLTVNETTQALSPKYTDLTGLEGQALTDAIAKNLQLYKQAVASGVSTQDSATAKMKQQIANYIDAMAKYNKGIASNTGLTWVDGVQLVPQTGATLMTGTENVVDFGDGTIKTAGMYATQGQNLDQNTDANFNNIFKIDGTGTIVVKDTSNGDVTLKFEQINSPYNTGTYVAIWGDNKGGIAWSVFALYNGSATGGAGEDAGGTGGIAGGRILNYVKSYVATATTSNGVSIVTFNDIDNEQTVVMSGLDGAKITNGTNVNQSGNSFSATGGDVSQGSASNLGTNGVRWNFDSSATRSFKFTHSTSGKNTSIVGGIFGSASQVPQKPVKPTLNAVKVSVALPQKPTAPKPVEVSVHYYKVVTTPTPEKPQKPTSYKPVTPQTPVAKASVGLPVTGDDSSVSSKVMTVFGIVAVALGGFVSAKKLKKDEE